MALAAALSVQSQSLKFDFSGNKKAKAGYTKVETTDRFSEEKGYGYDLQPSPEKSGRGTFYFSVAVPDGNYRVVATVGGKSAAGETTVRGESRRLFFENVATRKGETKRCEFVINKRDTHISDTENVRIKPRERSKLNWDDKLTIEINGDAPLLTELTIERDDRVPTIFLCGNSTVVDQDNEPWASWGQMVTRFFNDSVCVANYAESGERADTFIAAGRLKKLLTQMKPGDYIFMEFGHNDQKLKGAGKGAYYSFATCLKTFLDEARAKGANPVFVTPTQRRSFNDEGKIVDTHEDYPEAMRWVADRECVPVIELNEMTRTLYEAMGVEGSKRAFVHYPAGSYPGQDKPFADNTHFNPYGAYEIAKCILIGLQQNNIPLRQYIRADFGGFNPAQPDDRDAFKWNDSPFTEIEKPDGN
jgi:lysophospholipase L1-like esterase